MLKAEKDSKDVVKTSAELTTALANKMLVKIKEGIARKMAKFIEEGKKEVEESSSESNEAMLPMKKDKVQSISPIRESTSKYPKIIIEEPLPITDPEPV